MNMKLGEVIKEARHRANYTQQQVSDKTNISRNYISDIECGRYIPSVNKLIILSNVLDLDLNLIKNDGNTNSKDF